MSGTVQPDLMKDWKILVVDDEPDSLMVAQLLLEMYGAEVLTAINGREGLRKASQERPHFIISDLSMPDMNGWELVRALQNDRATAAIPIIALTAHAMEGDRSRAIMAGFTNYLTKPLQPHTFISDLLVLLDDIPALAPLLKKQRGAV